MISAQFNKNDKKLLKRNSWQFCTYVRNFGHTPFLYLETYDMAIDYRVLNTDPGTKAGHCTALATYVH
jgi:hypothetical protein